MVGAAPRATREAGWAATLAASGALAEPAVRPKDTCAGGGGPTRTPSMASIFSLVTEPPGAEKPPPQQHYYRHYAGADHGNPYADASGYADFMDGEDAFAELLRRSQQARANRRGQDLHYHLTVDFVDSITGATKRLNLPDGSTIDVTIPPGLVDGQTLRLKGKGAPGTGKGGAGDALIEVEVRPDRRFTRAGDDITIEVPISLTQAVLGGEVRVPTPTGEVSMRVPKGANTDTKLRLRGKGAPRRGGGHGDQFVSLKVMLPKAPDPELEAFVAGWKDKDYDPREGRTS